MADVSKKELWEPQVHISAPIPWHCRCGHSEDFHTKDGCSRSGCDCPGFRKVHKNGRRG